MMINCPRCKGVWFTSEARGRCTTCGLAWPSEEAFAPPPQQFAPPPMPPVMPLPPMAMPMQQMAPAPTWGARPEVSVLAVAACSLLPGGGHFYLGRHLRGIGWLAGFVISFATGFPFIPWIAAMVDACIIASKQNQGVQQFDR